MARRRSQSSGDDQPTAPFWMATFSDMVTLLLAFFVMLVAMSEVEVKKFEEALSYFNGHTGLLEANEAVQMQTPASIELTEFAERAQAERYDALLEQLIEHDLTEVVEVNLTDRGIHLAIADSIMFASGDAALLPSAETPLRLIADAAIVPDVQGVLVEGHTDSIPIQTARYPSNWELSAARAAAVVRFLLAHNDVLSPDRYQAAGYGEFRPRDTNTVPAGRAQNRRVEILLRTTPWLITSLPPTQRP